MDTILSESIGFNTAEPRMLMLDINSCFATVEQQANPLLRGKPVVVAAYATDRGCVLAASREAKQLGIFTGMRVLEAKQRTSKLVVLQPDSDKYRFINKQLRSLVSCYTDVVEVKSIDEMYVSFQHSLTLDRFIKQTGSAKAAMLAVATEIKERIRTEIGEWLTVSIGISTNRYLAKIASSYQKPDGLTLIDASNIDVILDSLALEELSGIKVGIGSRLRLCGITSSRSLYEASIQQLRLALHSKVGYYWWLRLHGWEADDRPTLRKSIGHQYALKRPLETTDPELRHILYQLILKMGRRLREDQYTARGVFLGCLLDTVGWWGERQTQPIALYADSDFYKTAVTLLNKAPQSKVRLLSIGCFSLQKSLYAQPSLFVEDEKKQRITQALDAVSRRFGESVVVPGRLLKIQQKVLDRVGFGDKYGIEFAMKDIPFD